MPQPGCPGTAPDTGSARSTATNPGTTSFVPRPPRTGALPCTRTPRTIRGPGRDRRPPALTRRTGAAPVRGEEPPVPLGDHVDEAVGHPDRGLVVDRVRGTGETGGPPFSRSHGVVGKHFVIHVRE